MLVWRVRLAFDILVCIFLLTFQIILSFACVFSAFMIQADLSETRGKASSATDTTIEWLLLGYFITSCVRELFHLLLSGFRDHFDNKWNVFDSISIVAYIIGFVLHSFDREERPHLKVEMAGSSTQFPPWKFFYGISLCFLWIRAVRMFTVFEVLGLYVLMFFRMISDVFSFLVLYFMLVIASSSLMLGVSNPNGLVERCNVDDSQLFNYNFIACLDEEYAGWGLYLFLRTWLQGWGRLFLEEMTSEMSVMVMLCNYLLLNVVTLFLCFSFPRLPVSP